MRKRAQIALAVLLVGFGGVVAFQTSRPKKVGPVYQGKHLQVWLGEYLGWDTSPEEWARAKKRTEEAVRHIGTNAIPTLLEMVRATNSPRTLTLIEWWDRSIESFNGLPAWVRHPAWYKNLPRHLNQAGAVGFIILGSDAQQAVPELMNIYEQTLPMDPVDAMDSQLAVIQALVGIGPPAIPPLLRWVGGSNEDENGCAIFVLSQIHAQPSTVVPLLVNALSHTNSVVRLRAAEGLGNFGLEAQQGVPALVQALSDPSHAVRREVTRALNKIAPEATVKSASENGPFP